MKARLTRRILDMHKTFGLAPGAVCGDCRHFQGISFARTYYKCDLTVMTHGAATDWRATWPACGRFEKREGKPVVHWGSH
ncbi:MAG: hypothetical protein FJ279_24605 [Planctomycetes bacterium]|nr:hypothetical protein [Planctomycetota bacterium]